MKSTENFKKVVGEHLNKVAAADPLFAGKLKKEGKSMDDCITYILNTVKNSGCNGFSDDEIFGMAMHYYDEDKIDIGKPISGSQVVVNHKVDLTEEEKTEARQKAKSDFEEIQLRELRQSQERKEAREKKKQERLKKKEAEREARRQEALKKAELSLF